VAQRFVAFARARDGMISEVVKAISASWAKAVCVQKRHPQSAFDRNPKQWRIYFTILSWESGQPR